MNEKRLLKISIFVAIIGIILLYIISSNQEISSISIEKINNEKVDQSLITTGKITDIKAYEKNSIITISETNSVTGIIFENVSYLKKGMNVEIIGTKNDENFIIERIRTI